MKDGEYHWPHRRCIAEEQWFDGGERLRVEAVSDGDCRYLLLTRCETTSQDILSTHVLLDPEQVAWLRFCLGQWTNSYKTNT